MRFLLLVGVFFLLFNCHRDVSGSFTHGQPCSERNTAFLYVKSWRLPQNVTNCVDITGIKMIVGEKIKLSNYTYFIKKASTADTLYADHMGLKRFPIPVVKALPNVEVIDMSGNNIRRLPSKIYKVAPKLTKLLLASNAIMIPKKKPLMASTTLQTLMLSENGIKNVFKFTFARLPALEVLYLDRNNIRYITPAMFSAMGNLKYLHLGQNYLSKVPAKELISKSLIHYITKSQRKIK